MYFDNAITIIFLVEALLKVIAFGFVINGKNSYLRSASNIIGKIFTCLN